MEYQKIVNSMCKNVRDSYKLYKESVKNPVDIRTYILYCNNYHKFLVDKVLLGDEVTLPARFGTLSIIGRKQKIKIDEEGNITGLAPDWVKTKQLWDSNPEAKEKKQLLYHTNNNTDNTIYKFFWHKQRIIVKNKILYSLQMTRENKRRVHDLIEQGTQYVTKH